MVLNGLKVPSRDYAVGTDNFPLTILVNKT